MPGIHAKLHGMPGWDDVRYFLEVSRGGTLAAAGKRLGVDYTTVGRRIAALERELGAKLFERTPDGFVSTEAGEDLRETAERMEAAALELERRALGADRRLSGAVRIASTEAIAQVLVLPAVSALHVRHPDIRVHVLTGSARLDIARREANLALRYVRPEKGDLVSRRFAQVGFAAYASKEYLAARPAPPAGASLRGHDSVELEEGIRSWQRMRLTDARTVLRVNNLVPLVDAVALGLGIGILLCCLGDRHPALRRVWPSVPPEVDDLFLVVHQDVQRTGRVRAVIDALEERCAEIREELMGQAPRQP
jgi:DNA-binding transcriptional LysR family regulator